MCVSACRDGSGCMPYQPVNAYLIHACTVQEGGKSMPAVMGSMVCADTDIFKDLLEQLRVCARGYGAPIQSKQYSVIDHKPVLHESAYF